jgi:rhamnose transport system ATP-binding protein
MVRQAAQLFTRLGVSIDPNRPARGLSIADQQSVEIAKALTADARVLVMDEPTAALTGVEVELGPPTEFAATNIDQFNF